VRVLHTGVLLTPDSGHVIRAAMKRDKPVKGAAKAAKEEKKAAPRQRQLYDWPDGILDRLEAKVRGS
jgi:hypothetical protein